MQEIVTFALGYLLGSVPFGLVIVKMAGLGDVRSQGSGNIGATNVLRTGRKDLALATLILDAGKGAFAVVAAGLLTHWAPWPMALAGAGAFLGHCFPVWLRFHGGKGVATYLGTAFAFDWRVGIMIAIIWLLAAATTRWSSAGALAAALCAPVLFLLLGGVAFAVAAAFMTALVFYRHKGNIERIRNRTEPKIGQRKTT
ncbi:glycerol-3-phosphate 1-O-acyltransferase PlsY [Parvularcula dongshanensis]|uniref:Glycerol-3-phosphate acyltransferase n=1 Tax=Parvularcula dongshanensis TaxID=1173995 RepID=A0A840I3E7_9PROT|nr:glycerol-3-phosphate 1-O-acyltransferase PlsY [Parvularcula dongshanensis]MBB4659379.1 glycerol-3-phosphate acyltransferase PlsY [Parvularcula dongshanensis]